VPLSADERTPGISRGLARFSPSAAILADVSLPPFGSTALLLSRISPPQSRDMCPPRPGIRKPQHTGHFPPHRLPDRQGISFLEETLRSARAVGGLFLLEKDRAIIGSGISIRADV
jgi:hypothetical protein